MAMSFWSRCTGAPVPDPAGHPSPQDTGHGDEVKRRRIHGKLPRVPPPDPPTVTTVMMAHRVWLDLSVIESRSMIHSAKLPSKLPDMAITCLRSWSPQPQLLWTYSAIEDYSILGLTVMALNTLMPGAMVAFMLAGNVPVQFIKDMLSMRILHQCGGLFMDMDIYWLGRPIQLSDHGYLFPEEPHCRQTGLWLGRVHRYPNLAMFAMPAGSEVAKALAHRWEDHWYTHAHAVLAKKKAAVDPWESDHGWMWNTRALQSAIAHDPKLKSAYRAPIFFCPWSKALTLELFNNLEVGEAQAPCLDNDLAIPYVQPCVKTIAMHSMCMNLWQRQWTEPGLQVKVLAQCAGIRSHNLGLDRGVPKDMANNMATQVEKAITAHFENLCLLLGRAVGHTVLGFVYAMFEAPWLQALLREEPRTCVPDGAHGFIDGCLGQGPWAGPLLSANHWCGALLYLAITLLCSPDHERSKQGSHPRAMATPQTGPAVDKALDFAMGLDCDAWPGVKLPVQAMTPWLLSHYNKKCDYTWPMAVDT